MARNNQKPIKTKGIPKNSFPHKDLITVKNLTEEQIYFIFDEAGNYFRLNQFQGAKKLKTLDGLLLINLFLEPSTRTRISFEIAAKRLGMDVVNFAPSDSSLQKDETIGSTVDTLYAMAPDLIVIRCGTPRLIESAAEEMNCPVINAGDGINEHPTQALLDAMTLYYGVLDYEKGKTFKDITITICGDIKHSRVAHSNFYLLTKLGAKLRACGPRELIPDYLKYLPVEVYDKFEDALRGTDIIMMLRYQEERMSGRFSKSWIRDFQLNKKRLALANKEAKIMHPGPVIFGKEIAKELIAPTNLTYIKLQVWAGVALRMALLDILTRPFRKLKPVQ